MSFCTVNKIVLQKELVNEVFESFNNAENVFLLGKPATGKTSFLIAVAELLKGKENNIIYAPKLTPPKYGLTLLYEQLKSDSDTTVPKTNSALINAMLKIFLNNKNVCIILDDLDKLPASLEPFIAAVLDISLKTGSPRVLASGRSLPRDDRIEFYFSKIIRTVKLSDEQAEKILELRYPDLEEKLRNRVIHAAHGQIIALLQLGKQAYRKVIEAEYPHAADQFVWELMPIGILLIAGYAIIAFRFLLYWEAQLAMLFISLYALRGVIVQFKGYAKWKEKH